MELTKAQPDINYPVFRMVSKNGKWEVGVRQMIYGCRVSAGPIGQGVYEVDYCCGDDPAWLISTLAIVTGIFEHLPETISVGEVHRMFPVQSVKPLINDPECWENLSQLFIRLKNHE